MSMYMKRQIRFEASQQANGRDPVIKRGDTQKRISGLSSIIEGGLQKVVVPIPTTDLDLMIDGVATGKVLYIETDTEITVKLDTVGDTGVVVSPLDAASGGLTQTPGVLYLETSFYHVYITVAGTSGTANIVVGILGA